MTSIPNAEPYSSPGAGNKCSKLLLKGELQLRVKGSIYSPEGRIHDVMH